MNNKELIKQLKLYLLQLENSDIFDQTRPKNLHF